MAPEAQSSTRYGTEVDIFAFGHLSLFVGIQIPLTDLLPYYDESDDGKLVNEVERRKEYFTQLYRNLKEEHSLVVLIKKCLSNSPKKRPEVSELVVQLDTMYRKLLPPPPIMITKKHASTTLQGMYKQFIYY